MAKRFTDTNKYKKPFLRGLQGAYKLLWDFLYHDCDHAGIWIVDFEIAQTYIGKDMPVNKEDALRYFNSDEMRIIEIDGGKKWFIPSFIEFQYGKLSEKNRAHINVINVLSRYNLLTDSLTIKEPSKPLTSPLQGAKEKELEKEQEKENKGVQGENQNNQLDNGLKILLVPELLALWKSLPEKSDYIVSKDVDMPALRSIGEMIASLLNIADYTELNTIDQIKRTFLLIINFILKDPLYKDFQLSQIAKYFNAITSKMKTQHFEKKAQALSGKTSIVENNLNAAQGAKELLAKKYGSTG